VEAGFVGEVGGGLAELGGEDADAAGDLVPLFIDEGGGDAAVLDAEEDVAGVLGRGGRGEDEDRDDGNE